MSLERLRNVKTGEVRDIETNSDEYAELINEVYDHDGSARPKWEITGAHHVRRMDDDNVQEEDLGYKFKPIPGADIDVSEVGPEAHPERALTQGEVDSGVESYEAKMDSLGLGEPREANAALVGAEPLEREDPKNRIEAGQEAAGSEGGGRKRSSRSSRKSSGSSGSGSGSSGSSAATKEPAGAGSGSGSGPGGSNS